MRLSLLQMQKTLVIVFSYSIKIVFDGGNLRKISASLKMLEVMNFKKVTLQQ